MCTLACWIGVFPEAPLVVAANRDERLGRASTPPLPWPGVPKIVAPRDDVAGGSWWAINEHGLFVALTNRAGANVDRDRRSRGLLLMDIARTRSLEEAEHVLRGLTATDYNGFHLFATDGRRAVRAVDTSAQLRVERLDPGFHLITEGSFGADEDPRDDHVRGVLEPLGKEALDVESMMDALGTHGDDPFRSLCVHLHGIDYGTRSSTVLVWGPGRRELRFAPGAPCSTPFENMGALLRELQ